MKHNFDEYFKYYVSLVEENKIDDALENSLRDTFRLIEGLDEEKGDFAYDTGKWTVKQLLCHLVDTERIFCNRALRFARNDHTELPGYDHDDYVNYDNSSNRTLTDILEELKAVRLATKLMYNSFSEEMLSRSGVANGKKLTVESIGFIIAGHERHHVKILKERYL